MRDTLAQRMFDANVRVEKMFWVGGICVAPPHGVEEFIEDDLAEAKEVLARFPWLAQENAEAEDILAELAQRNIDGFFVQLATPTPTDFHHDVAATRFLGGIIGLNGFSFRPWRRCASARRHGRPRLLMLRDERQRDPALTGRKRV